MRKLLVLCLVVFGLTWTTTTTFGQRRPVDEFANRRAEEKRLQQLRNERDRANRRAVPTFTIPQPSMNGGYGYGGGYGGYQNSGYPNNANGDYVLVPGGYQILYGQLVYVPPHYQFVPRYRW